MTFDPPMNVSFRSKIVDGKFFTLDGDKPVTAPYYTRNVTNIGELTPIEVHYILIKYSHYNHQLQKLATFVDKMKI